MTTETTTTIQQRAQWHLDNFKRGERESVLLTDGKIWIVKDRTENTDTVNLVATAHTDPDGDSMLPDDWRYEYIVDALGRIVENDGEYEQDWDELAWEIEGDVYHSNLSAWLASHLHRASYCDEAVAEVGDCCCDTFGRLMAGNAYEQRFVFRSVLFTIRKELDS